MAKIKLDKIIFTDTRTDFYVEAKTEKVYMRPHTVFDSEKDTRDIKFYTLGCTILITPITRALSENLHEINLSLLILIFLIALCLGLIFSYFLEKYTLRKQTLNKNFIEIKNLKILNISFKAIKKSSKGWTIVMCFGIAGAVFSACSLGTVQDSEAQTDLLVCYVLGIFVVGMVVYRTFRLRKSFHILKK